MANRPSVVAKMRPRGGLDLERSIHEVILPGLGVPTPEFLGFVSGSDGESDVLFLEYVGTTAFEPSEPTHQDAAGRWLGRCHGASSRASIPELVPRRSLDEERVELATTRLRLSETLDNESLGNEGRSLVPRVLELMDAAMGRWPEWAQQTASVPSVLTHGAFVTRNVRMRGAGGSLTTLPFDWDHVALRSPAVDLARSPRTTRGFAANASLEEYRATLASSGLLLDGDTVGVIAALGTVIRAAACIGWLVETLASDYVDRALAEIEIYRHALVSALRA
jgi:hypothetical protein